MQVLIVADIFGRTAVLEKMVSELLCPVEIFDPYHSKKMNFDNEKQAYDYFVSNIGLDEYTERLRRHIFGASEPLYVIGFSVGASAIWNISSDKAVSRISGASCFYGSQIRYNTRVEPKFPIKLIFPASEEHFSVSELISAISHTKNVEIRQVPFLHGFMNQHSQHYNKRGYDQEVQELSAFCSITSSASSASTGLKVLNNV